MMKEALEQRREVQEIVQQIRHIQATSSSVNVEAMEQMRLCQQQLRDLVGPVALPLLAATMHEMTKETRRRW